MKNESVVASNKILLSVNASQTLSLSPHLFTWTRITNPEWKLIDTWYGDRLGLPSTTEIRENNHGLTVAYISESTDLKMTNSETECVFKIEKNGDQITYTSMNSQGSVETYSSWGILSGVGLIVGEQAPHENRTELHEEHGIQYLIAGGEVNNITSGVGKKSVVISDSTYFRFTTNTSMYYSTPANQTGVIHQKISDELVKVENRILQGSASSGGNYALTDNQNNLYPDGKSTLYINDGFSESVAEIEFDHNTTDKSVKISVISHTVRVCEFRESDIVFAL
ncbi:hypothetical protein ACYZTM_24935 [Pseudomonas sp. MDT2-39-1]